MALREATRGDIRRIVEMLADDELGSKRETLSDLTCYETAFDAVAADPNNTLYVWDIDGMAMGCLQLTFLPGLSHQGAWRAQIEGVRIESSLRGRGVGEQMINAAVALSRARGCKQVQLTTNKQRTDAQRFYQRLGFKMSHEGMKLEL